MNPRTAVTVSAIMGFLAVALGAFGAHGLESVFAQYAKAKEWWATASTYHLIHSVVLLALALHAPARAWGWRLIFAGIIIFSGSLYVMALTGFTKLGAITPIGGMLLIIGWLAIVPWKKANP